MADDIALARDEEGRLGERLSLDVRKLRWIESLGTIAVQRTAKSSFAERLDKDIQIGRTHPRREGLRVHHALEKLCIDRLLPHPKPGRGSARGSEVALAKGRGDIRSQLGFGNPFCLEIIHVEKAVGVGVLDRVYERYI